MDNESIFTNSAIGYFDVVNFRDVTAERRPVNSEFVTFEFEFDPLTYLSTSLGFYLQLTWNQINSSSSGNVVGAVCTNFKEYTAQLERVGSSGKYHLSVPAHSIGEGSLLVKFVISISCISWGSYTIGQCGCADWQITGTSGSLQISAKRG